MIRGAGIKCSDARTFSAGGLSSQFAEFCLERIVAPTSNLLQICKTWRGALRRNLTKLARCRESTSIQAADISNCRWWFDLGNLRIFYGGFAPDMRLSNPQYIAHLRPAWATTAPNQGFGSTKGDSQRKKPSRSGTGFCRPPETTGPETGPVISAVRLEDGASHWTDVAPFDAMLDGLPVRRSNR